MKIHKNMTNLEIAELLRSVAAAYEIKNKAKYTFQIIAYNRAADAIEHLSSEVKDYWDDGKIKDVPGIGESMAKHLDEIFKTGKSKHFNIVFKNIPASVFEMMKVTGIGPKKAIKFAKELNITSSKNALKRLSKEATKGNVDEAIGKAIKEQMTKKKSRMLLSHAEIIAEKVLQWMKESDEIIQIEVLGSLRRKTSTVGDIDIAVATNNPKKVITKFINYPNKIRVINKGETKASIKLAGNIRVDLMTTNINSFGSLLQHFTGSKHHNIALRELAIKKGLKISEKTLCKTEKEFYKKLGLELIPPELREGNDEIKL